MLNYFKDQLKRKWVLKLISLIAILLTVVPLCYFISIKRSLEEEVRIMREETIIKVNTVDKDDGIGYLLLSGETNEYSIYSQLSQSNYVLDSRINYVEALERAPYTLVDTSTTVNSSGSSSNDLYFSDEGQKLETNQMMQLALIIATCNIYNSSNDYFSVDEGHLPENYQECVISEAFATLNGFSNWSSFTIRLKDFDNFENEIMTISMNEDIRLKSNLEIQLNYLLTIEHMTHLVT